LPYAIRPKQQPVPWRRPADWLRLPKITPGEQVVYILTAVFPHNSNFASILCQGAYTIDWGDGTIENYASNTQANHIYNYNSIPASTYCSRGYRQVIVTIRPKSGQNLTRIEFARKHPQSNLQNTYSQPWLDVKMSGQYINYAKFYGGSTLTYCTLLESFEFVGPNAITDASAMFQSCDGLQKIVQFDTSNVTNMSNMFQYCKTLREVPLLNTANVTTMNYTFSYCLSLLTIPQFNLQNVTSMAYTFQNCETLKYIPDLNIPKVTSMSNMFCACFNLRTVGDLSTPQLTNTTNMFYGDLALQSVNGLDMEKVTSSGSMFYGCVSLSYANLRNVTNSISLTSCRLSREAIVLLFNNLKQATSKTITITYNWGNAYLTADDRAIATNKGWTIAS